MVAASHKHDATQVAVKAYHPISQNITSLNINTGLAFVTEDPTAIAAYVVVSATNDELLDRVTFSEGTRDHEQVLTIAGINEDFIDVDGKYMVDIFVPSQTIRTISFDASGSVIVNPRTLVNTTTQTLSLTTSGPGDIYVQDSALVLNRIELKTLGPGNIQWDVPITFAQQDVTLRSSGSGDIAFFTTTLYANSLAATNLASGDIFVSTKNMTIENELGTQVSGSGDVSYYTNGTCAKHTISLLGSGDAYTSSITCHDTTVIALSSGDVYLTSTDSLSVKLLGSATVHVSRPGPSNVSGQFRLTDSSPAEHSPKMVLPRHGLADVHYAKPDKEENGWSGLIVFILFIIIVVRCCRCCARKSKKREMILMRQQPQYYDSTGVNNYPQQPPPQQSIYYNNQSAQPIHPSNNVAYSRTTSYVYPSNYGAAQPNQPQPYTTAYGSNYAGHPGMPSNPSMNQAPPGYPNGYQPVNQYGARPSAPSYTSS